MRSHFLAVLSSRTCRSLRKRWQTFYTTASFSRPVTPWNTTMPNVGISAHLFEVKRLWIVVMVGTIISLLTIPLHTMPKFQLFQRIIRETGDSSLDGLREGLVQQVRVENRVGRTWRWHAGIDPPCQPLYKLFSIERVLRRNKSAWTKISKWAGDWLASVS